MDLDLQRMTDKIFLVIHQQKIYVTSGGLSFVDIIYAGDFYPRGVMKDLFYVEFDRTYIQPWKIRDKYRYEVLPLDRLPERLITQLNVVRDSMHVDQESIKEELSKPGTSSKIDINKRLFYEVVYRDGTVCKVTNKPRITRIHFYCDQYRLEKDQAVSVLDISEPDYCEYLFKVSTRFMCAAGTQFRKASTRLHSGNNEQRPVVDLDAGPHTLHKRINCKMKSDF